MSVASICRRDIVTIADTANLREAAQLMRSQHVGSLVLTQTSAGQEQAVGLITDRDLVVEGLAREMDPLRTTVSQLARRDLAAIAGDADLGQAVTQMREAGLRRLLVTAADGHVMGIVSFDDVLEALAQQIGGLAEAVRSGITREGLERPTAAPRVRPVFLAHGTPGMQEPVRG